MKDARAHRLVRAAERLHSLSRDVILIPTKGPQTAGVLANGAIRDGADLIIAAGGDGTISEVVNGIAKSQIPLGILPAGTANVLAHEIGMRLSVIGASEQMMRCTPVRLSLGEIDFGTGKVHRFLLMAGVGFDAGIIYQLSAGWKDRLGKLSYFLGGIRRIGPSLVEFDVLIENERRRCSFALVSKVRNYGGDFEIARTVQLLDDTFEVVLFQGRNSWRYLRYLWGVATKTLDRMQGVQSFRTNCLEIEPVRGAIAETIHIQADGELVGQPPATIRIQPDALTLLVPAESQVVRG